MQREDLMQESTRMSLDIGVAFYTASRLLMRTSTSALFLIIVASAILNISIRKTILVLAGYICLALFDAYRMKKTKDEIFDYDFHGWEIDDVDQTYEDKGNLSRVRLTDHEQIIAYRVADFIRQLPTR